MHLQLLSNMSFPERRHRAVTSPDRRSPPCRGSSWLYPSCHVTPAIIVSTGGGRGRIWRAHERGGPNAVAISSLMAVLGIRFSQMKCRWLCSAQSTLFGFGMKIYILFDVFSPPPLDAAWPGQDRRCISTQRPRLRSMSCLLILFAAVNAFLHSPL